MKRFAFAALILAAGCSSATAPSTGVATVIVTGNGSLNGIFVGDQVQLTTTPYDYYGQIVNVSATYSTGNASVATVTAGGVISAVAAGSTNITATAGGKNAQVPVTVDGNITKTVTLTPTPFTMQIGHTSVVSAFVATTLGNPAKNKTLTWSSSDATKASVDSQGTVTAKVATTSAVNICATVTDGTGIQGCAAITVIP